MLQFSLRGRSPLDGSRWWRIERIIPSRVWVGSADAAAGESRDGGGVENGVTDYRGDFYGFDGLHYLNCAYQGPLPRVAVAAVEAALDLKRAPHRIPDHLYFDYPDAYREAIAPLIGARPAEIAVTNSATDGVMLLVDGLDWQRGDEVILARGEFPSNRFPWLSLAERGVVVREIEPPAGREGPARLAAELGERTRVVALSWVSYRTGLRLDLAALGAACREREVLFAVDGSQGVGGLHLDLAATPCDLLACAGYKFLLGPYGVGFARLSPQLAERLRPANVNWFAIAGARDFNRLSECQLVLEAAGRRFDVNETASFLNLAAAIASARYLGQLTPAGVESHVGGLLERLLAGLPEGVRAETAAGPGARSNIVCLRGPDADWCARAYSELTRRGLLISRREGAIRISPHVYNTPGEIDEVLAALAAGGAGSARSGVASEPPVGEPVMPREAPAPEPRVLRGEGVSLRPLDPESDAAELHPAAHRSPEEAGMWAYLPYGPFADRGAMRAWMAECARSRDPLFFAVVEIGSGRPVGMASLMRWSASARSIEIGHVWYAPAAQRTGVNTETVYLLLREAFERLGCRRVEWKCDALNARSRRAALRLGFRYEGLFRQHLIVKGRNRDTAWYALVDGEWPEVRANLEAWLAAGGARPLARRGPWGWLPE